MNSWTKANMSKIEKFFNRTMQLGFTLVGLGLVGTRFIFVVDGGERALIFDRFRGLGDKTYGEGMHFKIPFVQVPRYFEIRTRYRMITSQTGTRDLQTVNLTLRILFRPEEHKLPMILNNIGQNYDETILPSIGNEVLKAVVAQYDAGQLVTLREKVSADIRELLQQRASSFGLILDDISITDVAFSREFAQSIEAKQVAQQSAERAKFIVARQDEETRATIIRAEADSEAAKMVREAVAKHGQGVVAMRKIEASKFIVDQLYQNPNINFVQGANTMNMLHLNKGL